ncbi:putative HTH transcriptional regulator [Dysgonomonadaceae bacterium PH5-43]|nr:putative HTH transcriptional regulator [Dysgonomonadaceae bacterium PH5-43]
MAGYIERMGTGTRDIVNQCKAIGLREPSLFKKRL